MISLLSQGLSSILSSTTVQKHQFFSSAFMVQLAHGLLAKRKKQKTKKKIHFLDHLSSLAHCQSRLDLRVSQSVAQAATLRLKGGESPVSQRLSQAHFRVPPSRPLLSSRQTSRGGLCSLRPGQLGSRSCENCGGKGGVFIIPPSPVLDLSFQTSLRPLILSQK